MLWYKQGTAFALSHMIAPKEMLQCKSSMQGVYTMAGCRITPRALKPQSMVLGECRAAARLLAVRHQPRRGSGWAGSSGYSDACDMPASQLGHGEGIWAEGLIISFLLPVTVFRVRSTVFGQCLKASQNASETNCWSSQWQQQEVKGDTEVNSTLPINFMASWIKPI